MAFPGVRILCAGLVQVGRDLPDQRIMAMSLHQVADGDPAIVITAVEIDIDDDCFSLRSTHYFATLDGEIRRGDKLARKSLKVFSSPR
ncbi:hypothetical protein [Massilia sp. erpn]|uniref:hypothetical protein n=1 Tax=Massilia sp. erpn TaxID=2738142 RepID=UPI0021084AD3|nr:hypothetical protein [Massilia sp. erpn]UTY60255.1 hypothetical protein HPQ68_25540 [Massilia sp. erpn]